MVKVNSKNLVTYIMAFEGGEISDNQVLELFSYLVKSGKAWTLQGMYGRTAHNLMEAGYIDKKGKIIKKVEQLM